MKSAVIGSMEMQGKTGNSVQATTIIRLFDDENATGWHSWPMELLPLPASPSGLASDFPTFL
jgi:hypothetical protein